jgi:16S rRNA (adenine1518-N6/adenine1519-N6)-dimethyltransferase
MTNDQHSNQTLSFLKRRFAEVGIQPRTKLGQNFLIDLNLLRLLFRTADIGANDVVLEVGTGTGSLTALMAEAAAAVVTVELDPQLFQLASEELHGAENVRMLQIDALKNKNRVNPQILDTVGQELDAAPDRQFKLVANLPYNIATPLMTNLLALDRPPKSMTVTIQKELADRIAARPATKDYSALSIWIQSQCRVEIVRVMPPSAFWPRPKVHSAIVQITLDPELRGRIADREYFHQFVRAMFFHRRKFLRSELLSASKKRLDKPAVDRILNEMDLDGTTRAEELAVPTMLALSERVRKELGD